MIDTSAIVQISGAWLGYFMLHSLLASLGSKRFIESRLPALMPWYRLIFNLIATIFLFIPLSLLYLHHGPWVIELQGFWWWLAVFFNLLAIAGFIWSMRWYDGKEFLGIRQLKHQVVSVADQEKFHLSPLHRYVRHPWYSLGLLMLWSRSMDAGMLLSAILITLYMLIGLRLEEKKLLSYHGSIYKQFQQQVPALIPRPWRYLNQQQAAALMQNYQGKKLG